MKIQLLFPFIFFLFISCQKKSDPPENRLPVLATTTISQLSSSSVLSGGSISSVGNSNVTTRGVCWGTSSNPVLSGNHTTDGSGIGSFVSTVTGLLPATTYYLRSYATNSDGTAYGNEVSFTTLTPDVYVAGYDGAGTPALSATLWKNGVPQKLTNGDFEAMAYAVCVSGNDVYVAGYEKDVNGAVPKLWKNTVATALSSVPESYAYNVFVSGGDVYVAGEINGPPAVTAAVWKNSVPLSLDGGTDGSFAMGLFINGTDVYASGNKFTGPGIYYPAIWKNGIVTYLSSVKGVVQSVYVDNNDVYATGYEQNGGRFGKVWKNGVATNLGSGSNQSFGTHIIVQNGDVYVAFTEYVNSVAVAKYSKNGNVVALTDGTFNASASAIAVSGNDIYVAGVESNGTRNVVKVWKNGVATSLTNGTSFAGVNGIYIK